MRVTVVSAAFCVSLISLGSFSVLTGQSSPQRSESLPRQLPSHIRLMQRPGELLPTDTGQGAKSFFTMRNKLDRLAQRKQQWQRTARSPGGTAEKCGHILVKRPPAGIDSGILIETPEPSSNMPAFEGLPPCANDMR